MIMHIPYFYSMEYANFYSYDFLYFYSWEEDGWLLHIAKSLLT
jgi:hypothetical protein